MHHPRHWLAAVLALALAAGAWVSAASDDGVADAADRRASGDPGPAATGSRPPVGGVLFRVAHGAPVVPVPGGESVPVTISRQAALAAGRTGALTVVLPDGTRYPVRYERSESAPGGNWTFIGRVDSPAGALASVLTFGPDGVFGVLPTPDGDTMKLTTRAGQVYLQPEGWSIPPGADPSRDLDYVLPPSRSAAARPAAVATAPAAIGQHAEPADGEVTITILGVYTKNLSQLRGSRSAAETEYRNLVAVMNQAHIDSGTIARFEVADFVELDYPAGASNDEARSDIIGNTLPDGTDLHARRDEAAADLVAMIRPYVQDDLTCGISQFPAPPLELFAMDGDTGFSVTAVETCAPMVYAHEIGHNLGLMHDRETVAGPYGSTLRFGLYPFSFGHRQLGPPGFATVMAYDSESRPRIGYFSHPDTGMCGGADCGDTALADNVRSINLVAGYVARFRDPPGVIGIDDMWAYEYRGLSYSNSRVFVSMSSPAPAGGITFDVVIEGASATPAVDFAVEPGAPMEDILIPEGRTSAEIPLRIYGDSLREGPETATFRLRNVRGDVVVVDDESTLFISDDDGTVTVSGRVEFPDGAARPEGVSIRYTMFHTGFRNERNVWAPGPDYIFSSEVPQGWFLSIKPMPGLDLRGGEVILERVEEDSHVEVPLATPVQLSGRLTNQVGQGVTGVPVILWNRNGDGSGYYVNAYSDSGSWSYAAAYEMDVHPATPMQLEVPDPPAPFVRQIVEVPPLSADVAPHVRLHTLPSLTIPHMVVPEGTSADGERTVLLTASLSVPGTPQPVTFDIQRLGDADSSDYRFPKARFTIPEGRTRVEIPVVIVGDDRSEASETIELRITNLQGPAWNPGPGSVRIATDDHRPGDGRCTGSTVGGSVKACQ